MAENVSQPEAAGAQEEEVYVASQWRLMWWRFKKHRMAVISSILILLLYVVAVNSEFITTASPRRSDKDFIFLRPQGIRWFDNGKFSPHVNVVVGERNAETFRMEYETFPEESDFSNLPPHHGICRLERAANVFPFRAPFPPPINEEMRQKILTRVPPPPEQPAAVPPTDTQAPESLTVEDIRH